MQDMLQMKQNMNQSQDNIVDVEEQIQFFWHVDSFQIISYEQT